MTGSSPHASKNARQSLARRLDVVLAAATRRRARRRCRRRPRAPGSTGSVAPGPVFREVRAERALTPRAAATRGSFALMPSTTVGSASVVVSPSASSSATLRSSRRMILPERVFGQLLGEQDRLRLRDRADELRDVVAQLLDERRRCGSLPPRRITNAAMAWPVVASLRADDRGLGDRGMVDERGLDLGGRDVVAGDEHDVVDAAEQPEVAVVVALGAVAGEVLAVEARPVRVAVALRVAPDAAQHRRPRPRRARGSRRRGCRRARPRRRRCSASMPGQRERRAARASSVVAPGSGLIMIAPVSVCHHVSTTGQRSPPIAAVVPDPRLGVDRLADGAEQAQRRQVVRGRAGRRPTS